jgi:hypothetical protein
MSLRITILFFIICLTNSLQSCFVLNTTKNKETKVCDIHNKKLHKTIVKAKYGFGCPIRIKRRPQYYYVRTAACMGCLVERPKKRFAIVYYCPACNKARRKDKEYWETKKRESRKIVEENKTKY